jgi:hypothetical protein
LTVPNCTHIPLHSYPPCERLLHGKYNGFGSTLQESGLCSLARTELY